MSIKTCLLGGGDAAIERARRPEALVASMGERPAQGIDWLRRSPGPQAPLLYRLLIRLAEVFLFTVCDLRVRVEGAEVLPDGGYIAVCALHRSWVDPLLLVRALPMEPRVWFMGSGPTAFDRLWKEALLRRTGGLLPVWRGSRDISVHVRSAQAVIDEGAVLGLFAEGRIGGAPDAPAKMRPGGSLLALRTGAPIVPVAICGAERLYRGKRITVRVLDPTDPAELMGRGWKGLPEPGSRAELRTAHLMTRALTERLGEAITQTYPATVDQDDRPRRWSWLTRLMR